MNLAGLSQDEMEGLAGECGEKPYRGRQLYRQIFARKVLSLEQMSDLPGRFRESLESRGYTLAPLPVENRWARAMNHVGMPGGKVLRSKRIATSRQFESARCPSQRVS